MKKKISAEIVADSISPQGHRITTFLLTYPRFIHGELMTHRLFSRNSASSRAIPFNKMLQMVEEDPFIPIAWQKDHKGMQGTEYITEQYQIDFAKGRWINACKKAIEQAKELNAPMIEQRSYDNIGEIVCEGVTKQLCNRLLEPFMWHIVLVTATEYDNFFELRCPQYRLFSENIPTTFKSKKDLIKYAKRVEADEFKNQYDNLSELCWIETSESQAEIHIQALAEAMWDAQNESEPKQLKAGEWHIPFGDKMNFTPEIGYYSGNTSINGILIDNKELRDKIKVAIARCARLSYMTFDGEINYEKDIKLHDQLLESKHFSPFEHCAKCMSDKEINRFFKGSLIFDDTELIGTSSEDGHGWCNNFRGFIQYRYMLENDTTK